MKIRITEVESKRVEKLVECKRFTMVPGWVWPFQCEHCHFDIGPEELQVVADIDCMGGNICHFHVNCWNKCFLEGVNE